MTFDGTSYSGWDRYHAPIDLSGAAFKVAESASDDFQNPDRVVEITLPDDTYHNTRDSTTTGVLGFIDEVDTQISNSSLQNSYAYNAFSPSGYAIKAGLEVVTPDDPFELRFTDIDPGWFGFAPGTSSVASASATLGPAVQSTYSLLGTWDVDASLAQDQRGYPMRDATVSRGDTVEGRIQAGNEWTMRQLRYIQLASVDIWTARVFTGASDNPLVDPDAFDQSSLYSSDVAGDPNSSFRDFYRHVGLNDNVAVVWGRDAASIDLLIDSHTYEVGELTVPDNIFDATSDTEAGERYNLEMQFEARIGKRAH